MEEETSVGEELAGPKARLVPAFPGKAVSQTYLCKVPPFFFPSSAYG